MRKTVQAAILLGAGLMLGGTARALKPGTHRSISEAACRQAGLPGDFCDRMGAADYDTDANEWDDLAAHAQIAASQTACDAAQSAAGRLASLGAELRQHLSALAAGSSSEAADETAVALGRALHTVQDDCAHHGIPNPQHAWASLSDFCDGTQESPDIQPDAIACATRETAAVVSTFTRLLDEAGVPRGALDGLCNHDPEDQSSDPCRLYLPAPWQACSFLAEAQSWDGVDRRWNDALVRPALRGALLDALAGGASTTDLCGGDPGKLAAAEPAAVQSVAEVPTCFRAHLMCFGKADSIGTAALFDDATPGDVAGGCQMAGARGTVGFGAGALALLAILGLFARRRHG